LSGFYPLLPKNAAIHFFSWFFFVEEERWLLGTFIQISDWYLS
jgi:hypothetical protein